MSDLTAPSGPDNDSRHDERVPSPDAAVPASDPGEVGRALEGASPDDSLATAAKEGSISAGEGGRAVDAESTDTLVEAEVVIGEIPDEHDISIMRWTARCTDPQHDLLGHFDSEQAASEAKRHHLSSQH